MSPSAVSTYFLKISGAVTPLLPWAANAWPPFQMINFPQIQLEPPLAQLDTITYYPVGSNLWEEASSHLTTISFQVAAESHKVSLKPPPE